MTTTKGKRKTKGGDSKQAKRTRAESAAAPTSVEQSEVSAPICSSSSSETHSSSTTASSWSPIESTLNATAQCRPPSSHGWNELPLALFDRVCSYICSPMWDMLSMSAVCTLWSQQLDGGVIGCFDSWRHVPPLSLCPTDDWLLISPHQQHAQPLYWESAVRTLRHVRPLEVQLDGRYLSLPACIRFLDLLFSDGASSSSNSRSSHMVHLTFSVTSWPRLVKLN